MTEREQERAAIIEWLRSQSDEGARWAGKYDSPTKRMAYGGASYAFAKAPDAIEAGEHLRKE